MTNLETLQELLGKKIERQGILLKKSNELEKVYLTISGSKKGRWFGSSYLIVKRTLSIFLGIGLIIVGVFFLINPSVILSDPDIREELIKDSKQHYIELAGSGLNATLIEAARNKNNFNDVVEMLDTVVEKSLEKEIISSIRFLAGLLIILAFVFLYIARMTRKMKVRNQKISESETLTQDIIKSFRTSIQEEEQELLILQNMIRTYMNNKDFLNSTRNPPHSAS